MKRLTLFLLVLFSIICVISCINNERVYGNGKLSTKDINITPKSKLKTKGSIDVQLVQAAESSIIVQADENIIPLILVENNDEGETIIKTKSGYNISTDNVILVTYTTPSIQSVTVAGSGSVVSQNKISNSNSFNLSISGSGNATLNLHTPQFTGKITGSGNITCSGETQNISISISGNGDYKGEELMSENAKVKISGSGNVRLHADASLDVNITGSGDVFYKGNPSVKKTVNGSGNIEKLMAIQ